MQEKKRPFAPYDVTKGTDKTDGLLFNSLTLDSRNASEASKYSAAPHGTLHVFITSGLLQRLQISRRQTKPEVFLSHRRRFRPARREISAVDQAGKTHQLAAALRRRHLELRRIMAQQRHRDLCRLLLLFLCCRCLRPQQQRSAPPPLHLVTTR